MSTKHNLLTLVILLAVLLGLYNVFGGFPVERPGTNQGVNAEENTPDGTENSTATSSTILIGTTWSWVETRLPENATHVPATTTPGFQVTFGDANRMSVTGDCNAILGSFLVGESSQISIDAIVTTKKYCEGSQEDIFIEDIRRATSYYIQGDTLTLFRSYESETPAGIPGGTVILKRVIAL